MEGNQVLQSGMREPCLFAQKDYILEEHWNKIKNYLGG